MIKKLLFVLLAVSGTLTAQENYLDMDGTNDYVSVANSSNILANATNITMSCKLFPQGTTSGFPDFKGIMGYRNETNFDFYLIQLSTTEVEARFRNASGAAFTISYTGLTQNAWNHLFLVYNSATATLKLYNGTLEVSSVAANGAAPASNSGALQIGLVTYQAFTWYQDGYMDEMSLWDKALSAADISAIVANAGEIASPATETNLKLYYKCNQGIAYGSNPGVTTLNDELGLHNGTLVNFALSGGVSNWGSQTLGVNGFSPNSVKVYPNPAVDRLSVSGITETTSIQIVDLTGRIVSNQTIDATNPVVDVSQLTSGMYVFVANNAEKIKFLKK